MSSHSSQALRNGIKLLMGQVGINLFSLGFGIYFAHVLALRDMAILAVIVLIGNLFPVIASLGMNDTLIKKIPAFLEEEKSDEVQRYFIAALNIQIITTTLLTCFSLVFYEGISRLFYKSVLPLTTMLIIISYACMRSLLLLMNSMLRARQHFGRLSATKVAEQVSSRLISITLFFIWQMNGILLGMLMGSIICFLMHCYFLKDLMKHLKPCGATMKKIIQYSFPYYGAAWLRFSIMQADRYFVSIFFLPEQLAVYFVASKIIELVTQIIDSLADPVTSKLAQLRVYGVARIESIFKKIFKFYSLLYIPLIGLIIAFARPFIEIYGGAKYGSGADILMLLATGLILAPFSGMIETFVFIIGKPVDRLKIRFVSGLFSIVGAFILMKIFGVNGLALSKLFIWGIYIFIGLKLLKRYIRVSIDKAILLKVMKTCFPIIIIGIIIQIMFYKIYLVGSYFVIFNLILLLFYIKIIKKEPELSEFLPKQFKGAAK